MVENKSRTSEKFSLRRIRLSLKYRPEIFKLILKMRQTIRKKNTLLKSLKHQLRKSTTKKTSACTQTDEENKVLDSNAKLSIKEKIHTEDSSSQTKKSKKNFLIEKDRNVKNSYTQTIESKNKISIDETPKKDSGLDSTAWNLQSNGENEKSIAEQVKEAAQSAIQETGMVYVESAGMYYDYKTGYYYNSELGLYYHTDTNCYYYYSDEKQSFVFHSYPDKSAENESLKAHEKRKAKKQKQDNEGSKPKRKKIEKTEDSKGEGKCDEEKVGDKEKIGDEETKSEEIAELEDGECSDTESESDASTSTASDDESVAKHHPPCMRVIVRETNLPKLKVGTLYLITKDGGTLGREGDHHAIVIRDHNVSRNHLDLKYDMERRVYVIVDIGSKNGTILNGTRMSPSQERSSIMEVVHGSIIQLGETKLLCHIHAGNDTCGHCEPGLIMETLEKEKKAAYTRTCSVQKQHQLELARLKNKYAPQPLAIEETAYNDRAQARREKVGSSHHSEKTQSSDLNTCIASENKGFKLLEKMGWSKGEGLGKESQGDTEPIPLVSNEGKTGLGAVSQPAPMKVSKTLGPATLRLAARTKMLQPPAKAFQQPMDDEEEEY